MPVSVVRSDRASEALARLRRIKIHPHFAIYLCLKRDQARLHSTSGLHSDTTRFFRQFLTVSDSMAKKPFVRPFWPAKPSAKNAWLNDNVPGLYAPVSLRAKSPVFVVADQHVVGQELRYSLKGNHAQLARQFMLYGSRLPIADLALFLYRDYGLIDATSGIESWIRVFREEFGYPSPDSDEEFEHLFSSPTDQDRGDEWIESIPERVADQDIGGAFVVSELRTPHKVRRLTAEELELELPNGSAQNMPEGMEDESEDADDSEPSSVLEFILEPDDAVLRTALDLINDEYGGIILSGPPGTGKSYYAEQIAIHLAERDPWRMGFVQFHSSYQYEDFVEGFVPDPETRTFKLENKHLRIMCERAHDSPDKTFVLVIDELSRADPSRVFGEALTYLEWSRRGQPFRLASGQSESIPENLLFITTMNSFDRGVEEIDTALERRFARIPMAPDAGQLQRILTKNRVDPGLREKIIRFFNNIQRVDNPFARVGHAYFDRAKDEASLRRLWDHQLRFYMEKAYRLQDGPNQVELEWNRIFGASANQDSTEAGIVINSNEEVES